MKLFDINNALHRRILKEEIARAKKIIREAVYSADNVWNKMSMEDRQTALYAAKATNPEELINVTWDAVPADIQDQIDLAPYALANIPGNTGNMSGLRAIKRFAAEDPNVKRLVNKYLKKVKRTVNDLTVKQSYDLQTMISKLIQQTSADVPDSDINLNPRDFGGGPSTNPFNKGYTGD